MGERTFGEVIAILAEHDQTSDLTGVIVNDAFIDLICTRLDTLPVPPIPAAEVRRAWERQQRKSQGFPGLSGL